MHFHQNTDDVDASAAVDAAVPDRGDSVRAGAIGIVDSDSTCGPEARLGSGPPAWGFRVLSHSASKAMERWIRQTGFQSTPAVSLGGIRWAAMCMTVVWEAIESPPN
jgi:hypothetical protein